MHGNTSLEVKENGFEIPCVKEVKDRDHFAKETKDYPSLKPLRDLADRQERGNFWDRDILMQRHVDPVKGTIECIVVPKTRRVGILGQVHDRMGHLGHKHISGPVTNKLL